MKERLCPFDGSALTCFDRSTFARVSGTSDYARFADSSRVDASMIVSRQDCHNSAAAAPHPDAP